MPLPSPAPGARPSTSRLILAFVAALVVLAAALPLAAAQSPVERAEPPVESSVTASPNRLSIWFEQAVAAEPRGPSVQVVDSRGNLQPVEPPSIYSLDPRHITVALPRALAPGTYSVLWTVQFADEQLRSGAYGFRVGSSHLPGAATTLDAMPAAWALITRFLSLFGIALALAGLWRMAPSRVSPAPSPTTADSTSATMVLFGAALALIGTLAMPVFAALLAVPSQPVLEVARGYSPGWWLAVVALFLLAVLAAVLLARRQTRVSVPFWAVGLGLGLAALAGIVVPPLTGTVSSPALTAAVLLALVQSATVLLLGFALATALAASPAQEPAPAASPPSPGDDPAITTEAAGRDWLRWLLVVLAILALAGTMVIGSQTLSGWSELFARPFGQLTLALGVALGVTIALGLWLTRRASPAARWGIAALSAFSLGAAVLLALLAPPATSITPASLVAVNLVKPGPDTVAGEPNLVHLMYQPATTGPNAFIVWQASGDGVTEPAAPSDVAITLTALDQDTPPINAQIGVSTGAFTVATAALPGPGWWQAAVTVTPEAGDAKQADFFLLLPDPNVTGYGPPGQADPAAQAAFERGLAAMTSLQQVRFTMTLGGGSGTFAQTEIAIDAGDGDSTERYREQSPTYETVVVGDQQWFRRDGEPWTERQAGSVYVPAEWGETYARATGFTLGPVVEIGGEPAQVVSFWLPRQDNPRQEPAWFAWWVGMDTGQVHRETMVSTRHYMVYNFAGFNEPIEIEPPAGT